MTVETRDEIDELVDWQLAKNGESAGPMFHAMDMDDPYEVLARWVPGEGWGWVNGDNTYFTDDYPTWQYPDLHALYRKPLA